MPAPAGALPGEPPAQWQRWLTLLTERDLDAVTLYEELRGWLLPQLAPAPLAAVTAGMAALDFDAVLAALPAHLQPDHDPDQENQ
ncbi:hypothetical protein GM672_22725 [Massilia buxea]|nr:hypothetical protein [Pseudoduganella buxea]